MQKPGCKWESLSSQFRVCRPSFLWGFRVQGFVIQHFLREFESATVGVQSCHHAIHHHYSMMSTLGFRDGHPTFGVAIFMFFQVSGLGSDVFILGFMRVSFHLLRLYGFARVQACRPVSVC